MRFNSNVGLDRKILIWIGILIVTLMPTVESARCEIISSYSCEFSAHEADGNYSGQSYKASSTTHSLGGRSFYVDSINGDDANSGIAPDRAWKTLHPVYSKTFLDRVLFTNPFGQRLVELYYKMSPSIADFIARHDVLKTIMHWSLAS